MKICFVNFGFYAAKDVLPPLYEYSQSLSKCGIQITVFVRANINNSESKGNLTIRNVCREYFWTKVTHIVFIVKLVWILREERFDIIHIFNFPGISLLPIFCRRHQRKWFIDIQTGRIDGGATSLFYDKLTTFEARFFDKVIILSKGLRNRLFSSRRSKNISIIPLGANIDRFIRAKKNKNIWHKYKLHEKDIVLIYIGKLDRTRKLENMLKAFQIVVRELKGKVARLVIVGGEDSDRKRLSGEAKKLSIGGNIIFLEKVSYEDIPNYLVNSDIGLAYIPKNKVYDVQPPLKTLEYLAASLPVVATNTLGNLEIIRDGKNGIITTDKPEDFAQGILELLRNPKLSKQIKENSMVSITKYDWNKIVDRLLMIYQDKIMQGKNS